MAWIGTLRDTAQPSAYVNNRPVFDIGNGAPKHFMDQGRRVAASKEEEVEEIADRITFRPAEIGVGQLAVVCSKWISIAAMAFATTGLRAHSTSAYRRDDP